MFPQLARDYSPWHVAKVLNKYGGMESFPIQQQHDDVSQLARDTTLSLQLSDWCDIVDSLYLTDSAWP